MSIADLPKQYDPQDAQRRWYDFWVEKGYFHADPSRRSRPIRSSSRRRTSPGRLHLGHALNNTIQDILIRWRRMQGYDALWMPGTDHAGIATQAVVEKRLLEEEKKTRHDLGREELVARIWAWKDEYEKRILSQLQLMGCSCDWDRTRFTLDPICAGPSARRSSTSSRPTRSSAASGWSTGTPTSGPPSPTTRSTTRTSRASSGRSATRSPIRPRRVPPRRHHPSRDDARRHRRRRPPRRSALTST